MRREELPLAELEKLTNLIRRELKDPYVLFLEGDMGAGKTTFVSALFPEVEVSSPTYSLIQKSPNLAHLDCYRIQSEDEFEDLELEDLANSSIPLVVEWGHRYRSEFEFLKNAGRTFYILEITSSEISEESRSYYFYQED